MSHGGILIWLSACRPSSCPLHWVSLPCLDVGDEARGTHRASLVFRVKVEPFQTEAGGVNETRSLQHVLELHGLVRRWPQM